MILISLAHWAAQFDGRCIFGAYVWPKLCSAARDFLFGRRRFNSAALKNAERHERAADETISRTNEGEQVTRGERAQQNLAKREVNRNVSDDRHNALLHDLRQALQKLDTLTSRERKVLQLRYLDGLGLDRIAPKMKLSPVSIKRICRSAIGKLRAHFTHLGSLSPEAPLPHEAVAGDSVHWRYRK